MKKKIEKLFFTLLIIGAVCFISCNDSTDNPVAIDFNLFDDEKNSKKISDENILRVAIATMISPKKTYTLYEKLFTYISNKLDKEVEFTQILTYEEVNKLLINQEIDIAFICTGPYIDIADYVELLVVPLVGNEPYYQAYVITHKESGIKDFLDFKEKTFVYTDPQSNTGKNYPILRIRDLGEDIENFFSSTTYSYSHDAAIDLVAKNLVHGASVDGLIYDYIENVEPEKTNNINIIEKSEKYGIPPIVVSLKMNDATKENLRKVFVNMHDDSEGKEILDKINIDKFIFVSDTLYNKTRNSIVNK